MKKIIGLIILASLLISCSDDDNVNSCNCDARYRDEGMTGFYVIQDVKINCDTAQPLEQINGTIFLGCDNRDIP